MADFFRIDVSDVMGYLKINLGEKLPKGFNTRKMVSDIADFMTARMKVRTLQGRDTTLQPFKPYAPRTVKSRAKRGRQTSVVDLFDTGKMLAGIGGRVLSDTEAQVSIFDAIQGKKAAAHQFGTKHMPVRRFFGVSTEDTIAIKGIEKIVSDELDKALKSI